MKDKISVIALIAGLIILLLLLSFVSFFSSAKTSKNNQIIPKINEKSLTYATTTLQVKGKSIQVDISDNVAKRTLGLSGRTSLAAEEGMLFVFETPGVYGFWMKDMNISIDIIWIDENHKVVHIEKSVSPETYPDIFTPAGNATYVLETQSGFSARAGLQVGDKIEF